MTDTNQIPDKSIPDYNPIGCEHKKANGFSAWDCLSTSTGSGPDLDFDINIMVCMNCGDIKIIGRRLYNGKMNYFSEIFDINYPDAVAAIVKACNWFHRDTEGFIPFVQASPEAARYHQPAERFKKPTDEQVVGLAILFNDGKMEAEKLSDMVALCEYVIDRLYENGDILIPSSKEK